MEHTTEQLALVRGKRTNTPDKRVADLQWRINFSQMKLNHWPDGQNDRLRKLLDFREGALSELIRLEAA